MDPQLTHIHDAIRQTPPTPSVSPDEALELSRRYPYFIVPAMLALRDTPRSELPAEARLKLMQHIALNAPDPAAVFLAADVEYADWTSFYPAEQTAATTTDDAITKFLKTYGHTDPREEALLERLIFNPTPDYASVLERADREEGHTLTAPSTPASPDGAPSQDDLIASFILKHSDAPATAAPMPIIRSTQKPPTEHTVPSQASQSAAFDTSLSESLAKIYIRQKRFDKAFEIIHTLSLNNPKKSSYFADQMRFLRKLMLNREAGSR